ncbi:MAG: 3'-5' exonuclease [Clostridiaceae bacterium]
MIINSLDTYTAFDVETPNAKNDSICSLGLVHVKDGRVVSKEYYLVDPEDRFDYFNVKLHGISMNTVKGEPSFPKIWEKISDYFTEGLIVAHNATFDLNVLSKTLHTYRIDVPKINYVCTMKLSRKYNKDSKRHGLDHVCNLLGVDLEHHHNAMDDAEACQGILERMKRRYEIKNTDIQHF